MNDEEDPGGALTHSKIEQAIDDILEEALALATTPFQINVLWIWRATNDETIWYVGWCLFETNDRQRGEPLFFGA